MPKLILISLTLISSAFAFQISKGIHWSTMQHDFGSISDQKMVKTKFIYYNHSDSTFEIENVVSSCGCTVSHWSREPITPKDSGEITIEFDPKGKSGHYEKVVGVYSSHGVFDLVITADVIRTKKRKSEAPRNE